MTLSFSPSLISISFCVLSPTEWQSMKMTTECVTLVQMLRSNLPLKFSCLGIAKSVLSSGVCVLSNAMFPSRRLLVLRHCLNASSSAVSKTFDPGFCPTAKYSTLGLSSSPTFTRLWCVGKTKITALCVELMF